MQSHRYAQARLGFRQMTRLYMLFCKEDEENEEAGEITPKELRELNDLAQAVSHYPGVPDGEKWTALAWQLLGCRTVMPPWMQTYFCEWLEALDPSQTTYHDSAVNRLMDWLPYRTQPKDWRRQFYPIYLADAAFHRTGEPSPEGFDVWLINNTYAMNHASELWPWNPQELIA